MTREDIIRVAQECHLLGMRPHLDGIYEESLERFFHAAYEAGAAAEREGIATMFDNDVWTSGYHRDIAEGIRARGEK